eukprot:scaffold318390_cov17-Prasinocladus_malaysianus.AAC.1
MAVPLISTLLFRFNVSLCLTDCSPMSVLCPPEPSRLPAYCSLQTMRGTRAILEALLGIP